MTPIETLKSEHRLIERTLDALTKWSARLVSRNADERSELGHFVTFVQEFVDPVHHGKEEDILFATLAEHGFPKDQGPVAVMLHEHEECRELIRALAARARQSSAWSEADLVQIARTARSYVELLRQHILKEDQILYPMAEAHLPGEAKTRIASGFERFEKEKATPEERARLIALAESFIGRHQ